MFDIDLLTNSRAVVGKLKRKHRRVLCYFSAGTNESFRSRSQQYPPQTRGQPLADYPDEQWLDILEYELKPGAFCPRARKLGFSSLYKRLDLGVYRRAC